MVELSNNLVDLKERIGATEDACGLKLGQTQLVCVTKLRPVDNLEALYALGERHFAENRLKEALLKITALPYKDIQWHFIGPLQSNKAKLIAQRFTWVQSLDSSSVAHRLNRYRPLSLAPLNVLIQVNISNEQQKSGVLLSESEKLEELIDVVLAAPQLRWRGLMGMSDPRVSRQEQSEQFKSLRVLFDKLCQTYSSLGLDTLSMGMSDDWVVALENDASMLRIGRGLFKGVSAS